MHDYKVKFILEWEKYNGYTGTMHSEYTVPARTPRSAINKAKKNIDKYYEIVGTSVHKL